MFKSKVFKEILHSFKEGWKKRLVVWFKDDYENIVNGNGHSAKHREIVSHFNVVKLAIENPDQVNSDKDYKRRECYYVFFKGDGNYKNVYMKVVLGHNWFNRYGKLVVVTAYFLKCLPINEKSIWTKN